MAERAELIEEMYAKLFGTIQSTRQIVDYSSIDWELLEIDLIEGDKCQSYSKSKRFQSMHAKEQVRNSN